MLPCYRRHVGIVTSAMSISRDVRPMPMKVISVGKGNSEGAKLMGEEWAEKVLTRILDR